MLQMGFQGAPFTGVFDGSGHTISHLTITGEGYLGLFGRLGTQRSRPTVKELGIVDVNMTSSGGFAGGLVGYNDGGTVARSHATGVVNGSGFAGGLVGYNYGGTVTRCGSAGVVKGKVDVGGLVGRSEGSGAVIQCYSESVVSGNLDIGGLVGRNQGAATQSYSTGAVNGTGDRPEGIGGLVGANSYGNVTQCYSHAAVNGYYAVGGLVGWNGGDVTQCYSTGKVVSEARPVAGLVGDSTGYATAIRSFWDTQTSGQTKSSAGVGKTTAEMETASTFLDAGWDFVGETANGTEDIWWIDEGKDYPHLWWEKYSGGSGTADDPYQIATAGDLIALGERPGDYDKHFLLTADIDLDPNLPGGRVFDRAVIAPDVNDTEYWFQGTAFTGAFDGAGHAIRNLTIVDPNHDCLGLFGMIAAGGQVSDFVLVNAAISGGRGSINVGTLAGCNAGPSTTAPPRESPLAVAMCERWPAPIRAP